MTHRIPSLAAVLLSCWCSATLARPYCGELQNAFGPFDYRTAPQQQRDLVDGAHFTESVEAGVKGNTGSVGGDIDYTLRAFPNHPRALTTLITVTIRNNALKQTGTRWPTECYFERAVRFQPDDSTAWMLYARYLYVVGQDAQAMSMLERAVELAPDNPTINYNMGLALAKQKKYSAALPYAQKAYAMEFPLPGLKGMLEKAGVWIEPPPRPKPAEDATTPAQSEPKAADTPPTQP